MVTDRIKADLYTAAMLMDNNDMPFLKDLAAYHTQQALEKCLKYYLNNIYGISKKSEEYFTHNIASLFISVDSYDKSFTAKHRELAVLSNKITAWESMGRYSDMQVIDNDISLLTVSRVLELTKDIYEEILEYEKLNQSKAKTKAKHIKKNLKYREDRNYEG